MSNPQTHDDDNWSAAGMVGLFDAVHRQRDRARYRRNVMLWTFAVIVCLGIPLWMTWIKFQDARRQTLLEEFASRRPSAQQLTLANPAVRMALEQADKLRDTAQFKSVAESIADLRQGLTLLAEAHEVDGDLKRLRGLLDPLGKTLIQTPWHVSATVVENQQKNLGQRHALIVRLLDQGKIPEAETLLARLLTELGQLQRDNIEAMKTDTARQNWLRAKSMVPSRLSSSAAVAPIFRRGNDGDQGWNDGDWNNSRLCYLGAVEDLQVLLETQLTPEEKANLVQSDAEAVVRLETEKAEFRQKIDSLENQIQDLRRQLATTNGERQVALAEVNSLMTERDRLQSENSNAGSELTSLRPLKAQLTSTTESLAAARERIEKLTSAKQTAEELQTKLEVQLAARDAEVDVLRSAVSESNTGPIVQVSSALAAIDSRLITELGGEDPDADIKRARENLDEALEQYDTAVRLKEQALAEQYLSTSSKVKGIESTIDQAETTLRAALRRIDEPFATRYEQLQSVISSAEADYRTLLKEVQPKHRDAEALRNRIDNLKANQSKFAAGQLRHQGKSKLPIQQLVTICRAEVQELLAERRTAEVERLKASGIVPTAAGIEFAPISPGTFMMGSTINDEEKPVHAVTIRKSFFVGKHEVTVGQILSWLNSADVTFEPKLFSGPSDECPIKKSGRQFALNTNSKFGKSAEQPMVYISRRGALAFCDWCSKQDPIFKYRLPTEAEWEYFAKAATDTAYPWGDACNGTEANIDGTHPHGTTTTGPYNGVTIKVGSYEPNLWGLYDTVGNVGEWCSDWYGANYYGSSPEADPHGPFFGLSHLVRGVGSSHLVRGGSWRDFAIQARSARRHNSPDCFSSDIGFRVVAE